MKVKPNISFPADIAECESCKMAHFSTLVHPLNGNVFYFFCGNTSQNVHFLFRALS